MAIYIFLYTFLFIPIIKKIKNQRLDRNFIYFSIPLLLTVSIKGETGTDTHTYIHIILDIIRNNSTTITEPGFNALIILLGKTTSNPIEILNTLSCLIVAASIISLSKIRNEVSFILYICIASFILIDASMNAVRFGLALSTFLIGLIFIEKNWIISLCLFIISTTFQFTISYIEIGTILTYPALKIKDNLYYPSLNIATKRKILFLFIPYLFISWKARAIEKFLLYTTQVSTTPAPDLQIYSGLSLLIATFLFYFLSLLKNKKSRNEFYLTIIAITLFSLVPYSYMFLRLLQLNLILIATSTALQHPKEVKNGVKSFTVITIIIFIMIIGSTSKLKNFYDEQFTQKDSPFIPYRTMDLS